MVSVAAGVFVAANWRAGALHAGRLFEIVGVALFVVGLLLRWWAIVTLGRFFTVDVTMRKVRELVERGPFRLVRHPSYTGVLLAFVGFALTLRNWGALLVILVPIFAAFIHRMNVEEEALSRRSVRATPNTWRGRNGWCRCLTEVRGRRSEVRRQRSEITTREKKAFRFHAAKHAAESGNGTRD